ncbi:hypothetical protein B0T20DRAFT_466374 [Sordaria brevicollis]|uniref:CCHC-type domain-containing protein n=1 Tax=Sordaria brevicollis TaxID=83679 RepID=A0AAE0PK38_SORBR|nr:hypothetical protein B0T20DRAFT_466374 [Sordaria brevicollis]
MDRDSRASSYHDRDRDPNQDRGRNQGRGQYRGQGRGQYRGQYRGQTRGRSPRGRRSLSPPPSSNRQERDRQDTSRVNLSTASRIQRVIQSEAFEALTIEDLPRPQDIQGPSSGAYIFPCVPEAAISFEHPKAPGKPDLLERVNPRDKGSLHWYSPAVKDGKFRIKSTLSDEALEHLVNTIKYLGKQRGAVSLNMDLQLLTPENATEHHYRTARAYDQVRQSANITNRHPSQAPARSASLATLPARRPEPKQATELLSYTDNGPEQPQLICGNCKKPGHTLADCVMANKKSGFVEGCPHCNDSEHLFDECEASSRDEKARFLQALEYMYLKRFNKPMILTQKYPWPYVVMMTVPQLVKETGEDITVDEYMEREKFHPPNHSYPWSTDFARDVMTCSSVQVQLRFKRTHPCDFDYQEDDALERLPVDTSYRKKSESFTELMKAFAEKKWTVPVPPTSKQQRVYTDRGAHMSNNIRRLLDDYNLLPTSIQTRKSTKRKSVKEEDNDARPNPLDVVNRYERIRSKAREETAEKRPENMIPAQGFQRPWVEAKSRHGVELMEIFDECDGNVDMEGAHSHFTWTTKGWYLGSTWNTDKPTYQLVDKEGEWCAYWAVWSYIHLSSDDFDKLPRGEHEGNTMKRLSLETIDDILLKWKRGQLPALRKGGLNSGR